MMTARSVVTRFITEVWSEGRFDRAAAYIDVDYDLGILGRGPGASAANARSFREAFPDLAVEIVDVIEEGPRVAVWMRLSGTQHGASAATRPRAGMRRGMRSASSPSTVAESSPHATSPTCSVCERRSASSRPRCADSHPGGAFDQLTALAARHFDVPSRSSASSTPTGSGSRRTTALT